MLIYPTALDLRIAVKVRNIVGSEECSADVAYETTNAVYRKNVQGVVDS